VRVARWRATVVVERSADPYAVRPGPSERAEETASRHVVITGPSHGSGLLGESEHPGRKLWT
jgi:hypothetical protein